MLQSNLNEIRKGITLEVTPLPSHVRFRYKSEGKDTGGKLNDSDKSRKPTIKFSSKYKCEFLISASIVDGNQKDKGNYQKPHPHTLVGKNCFDGVLIKQSTGGQEIIELDVGIKYVTKTSAAQSLEKKMKLVRQGFDPIRPEIHSKYEPPKQTKDSEIDGKSYKFSTNEIQLYVTVFVGFPNTGTEANAAATLPGSSSSNLLRNSQQSEVSESVVQSHLRERYTYHLLKSCFTKTVINGDDNIPQIIAFQPAKAPMTSSGKMIVILSSGRFSKKDKPPVIEFSDNENFQDDGKENWKATVTSMDLHSPAIELTIPDYRGRAHLDALPHKTPRGRTANAQNNMVQAWFRVSIVAGKFSAPKEFNYMPEFNGQAQNLDKMKHFGNEGVPTPSHKSQVKSFLLTRMQRQSTSGTSSANVTCPDPAVSNADADADESGNGNGFSAAMRYETIEAASSTQGGEGDHQFYVQPSNVFQSSDLLSNANANPITNGSANYMPVEPFVFLDDELSFLNDFDRTFSDQSQVPESQITPDSFLNFLRDDFGL